MGKITIASLQKRKDHLKLGDVCFFATPQYTQNDFYFYTSLLNNSAIMPILTNRIARTPTEEDVPFLISLLNQEYRLFREDNDEEPEWIDSVPEKFRTFLRQDFLCTDPRLDAQYFPKLPYSGFGYIVLDDGLTGRVCEAFNLYRLSGVSQLGFLCQPITMEEADQQIITFPFPHTRYNHVFDVRAVAKLILANNNATEHEHLLSDVACLSHDARTPAGSDSVKGIDFKAFDEDVHYPKVLATANFDLLPEISEEDKLELTQIILNRGKLGAVLDVADKIAYISRDTFYFMDPQSYFPNGSRNLNPMEEARRITSLWETVCIEGDQVYFEDKDRLVEFLEHRAKMFSRLYQNPNSRFWEQLVKTFVLKRFYETGRITEDDLLRMEDWQLKDFIHKEVGQNILDPFTRMNMRERREGYQTLAEAEARKAELISKDRIICIIEKAFPVKAGAHFFVKTKNGLTTLQKDDPATAAHLHTLAQPPTAYNLYYLDIPTEKLPRGLRFGF